MSVSIEVMSSQVNSRSVQFAMKRTIFGRSVLLVREAKPMGEPGMWEWGRWKRPSLERMLQAQHGLDAVARSMSK